MAYSQLGVINLALYRLGVRKLSSLTDGTPQQIQAVDVWEYIRDEVLETREWRFAKTREKLARAPVSPLYTYDFAYVLPADFLKMARGKDPTEDPALYPISILDYKFETLQLPEGLEKVTNGTFAAGGAAPTGWTLGTGWSCASAQVSKAAGAVNTLSQLYTSMISAPVVGESYQFSFDVVSITGGALMPQVGSAYGSPVSDARTHTQIIVAESATAGLVFTPMDPDLVCTIDDVSLFKVADRLCILTDYEDSETNPLYVTYIKRVTDVSKYSASFVSALAWRLAQEIAINRTESPNKISMCKQGYEEALVRAEEVSGSLDYVEQGSDDWEMAGR